jgi:hypothetical protein
MKKKNKWSDLKEKDRIKIIALDPEKCNMDLNNLEAIVISATHSKVIQVEVFTKEPFLKNVGFSDGEDKDTWTYELITEDWDK